MPIIIITSKAYKLLMAAARARMPADTVGALLGSRVATSGGQEYFTVVQAVALDQSSSASGAAAFGPLWQTFIQSRLDAAQPIGWFLADPAASIFAPRLNKAQLHAAFQPNAPLFLDLDMSTNTGVFYIRQGSEFVPQPGVIEATPGATARAYIPWPGVEQRAVQTLDAAIVAALAPATPPGPTAPQQPPAAAKSKRVTTPLVWPASETPPVLIAPHLPAPNGIHPIVGDQAATPPPVAVPPAPNGANGASNWLADILAEVEHQPVGVGMNGAGSKVAATNGRHEPYTASPAAPERPAKNRNTAQLLVLPLPAEAGVIEAPQQPPTAPAAMAAPRDLAPDKPPQPALASSDQSASSKSLPGVAPAAPPLALTNGALERAGADQVGEWTYATHDKAIRTDSSSMGSRIAGQPGLFLVAGVLFVLVLLALMWFAGAGATAALQ